MLYLKLTNYNQFFVDIAWTEFALNTNPRSEQNMAEQHWTEQNRTTGTACLGILFCLPLARFVLSRLVFRTCKTNDQILYHASFSCRFELYGISALLLSHLIFDVLWTSMRFYYLSFKFIIDELQRSLLWSTTKNSFRWFAQSPFIFQADQIESSSKKGPKSWVAQQFTPLW